MMTSKFVTPWVQEQRDTNLVSNSHESQFSHCVLIALFYYTLGNIDPKYRSTMRCIQLLTIVKSTVLQKYGVDTILEPFMEDLKALEQVK